MANRNPFALHGRRRISWKARNERKEESRNACRRENICLCGLGDCPVCGPLVADEGFGDTRCPVCGKLDSEGGCVNPIECAQRIDALAEQEGPSYY